MKAVVVEIRDNQVAALSNDGRITKIKNQNYTIGQEIEMKEQLISSRRIIKIASTVAAAIMLFVVPVWAYFTPYSYVSLDVNPSVEYTVNIFDRVLIVKAVNDDGEAILKNINLDELKNQNIELAVQEILNEIIDAGFFEEGKDGGVVIATSSKNDEKAEKLAEKLKVKVQEDVDEDYIEVETIVVGEERVQKARELGITPGKLNLVQKLQESLENPDDINIEDWLNKPVKEIMKVIKENKKLEKAKNKENNIEEKKESKEEAVEKENKAEEKVEFKEERAIEKGNKAEEKLEFKEEEAVEKENKAEEKVEFKEERAIEKGNKAEEKLEFKEEKVVEKENKAEEKLEFKEEEAVEKENKAEEKLEFKEEKVVEKENKAEEKAEYKEEKSRGKKK